LNAAEKWIKGGAATLLSFMVIAFIITILSVALSEPSLSVIAMINALLGAAIGLPLVFVGKAGMKRARRVLSLANVEFSYSAMKPRILNQNPRTKKETDLIKPEAAKSVTENPTLNLRRTTPPPREK